MKIINSLRKKSIKNHILNNFNIDTPAIKYLGNGKFILNSLLQNEQYQKVAIIINKNTCSLIFQEFDKIDINPHINSITKKGTFICSKLAITLDSRIDDIYIIEPLHFDHESGQLFIGYYLTHENKFKSTN